MEALSPALEAPFEGEAQRKVGWLIALRWIAAACLFLLVSLVHFFTPIKLSLPELYAGNAALALSNIGFLLAAPRGRTRQLVGFQIVGDLALLAWLLYFSGGFENPFVSFAGFHMIIASIFLAPRQAYGAATLATFLLGGLAVAEALGLLPHHHLAGFALDHAGRPDLLATLARTAVLALTLYLTVYLTTTIMKELARRKKALALANITLENQDREKSRYVRVVSHDIRASVSAIQSCLKVVLEGFTGGLAGKSREMVERAERRSISLLRFLEELGYLSMLRSETEPPRVTVCLAEALEEAIRSARERIDRKRLALEVEASGDTRLAAYREELERLAACLLDNAVTYTPEGGRIRLKASEVSEPPGVRLAIEDTGIGIPGDEIPRVCEDFYRAANASGEEGTGLGLSIVKEIVDRYAGSIHIDSREGAGTSVVVNLPRRKLTRPTPA